MKKIILSAVAVLAFGFTNAQAVKFGAKAGLNISNYTGDIEGNSSKTGLALGVFAEIKVSDKFSVQPEVLYSVLGAKSDLAKINASYLNIPVMAKYYVAEGFNLQAGPQFGFVAGGDAIKDSLKSFDYGLGIGAGYELESGLFFDARYNLGLADLNDTAFDAKITTNSFNVGLGYRF